MSHPSTAPLSRAEILERRLASLDAGAAYTAMSTKTIRRRIADGTITGYRVGPRLLRVSLTEIDEKLLCPIPTVVSGAA